MAAIPSAGAVGGDALVADSVQRRPTQCTRSRTSHQDRSHSSWWAAADTSELSRSLADRAQSWCSPGSAGGNRLTADVTGRGQSEPDNTRFEQGIDRPGGSECLCRTGVGTPGSRRNDANRDQHSIRREDTAFRHDPLRCSADRAAGGWPLGRNHSDGSSCRNPDQSGPGHHRLGFSA